MGLKRRIVIIPLRPVRSACKRGRARERSQATNLASATAENLHPRMPLHEWGSTMVTKQSIVIVTMSALSALTAASPAHADDTCGCESNYAQCVQSSNPPPPNCHDDWQNCDDAWTNECNADYTPCYYSCLELGFGPAGCSAACGGGVNACLADCD